MTIASHTKNTPYNHNGTKEDAIMERVRQYLPLARSIAARMRISFPSTVHTDDICSIALLGLVKAAQRFDASHGRSFPSYARTRIQGALIDELRRLDRNTRTQRKKAKEVQASMDTLYNKLGRTPTEQEIAAQLGVSLARYHQTLDEIRPISVVSLDAPVNDSEDGEQNLIDKLDTQDDTSDTPAICERKDLIKTIKQEIVNLPETNKKIIALYYEEELTLAEIAKAMGLSESRICQLHTQTILSLRATAERMINPIN